MSTELADDAFIRRSIELAVQAGANGNRPFGAVLVSTTGDVISEGCNEVASSEDVTAHAELVAIRRGTADGLTSRFAGSVMYASGEPCPMCAAACVWAGVGRIVFGASTQGFSTALPDGPHFDLSCSDVVDATDADVEVHGPTLEQQVLDAMRSALGSHLRSSGD